MNHLVRTDFARRSLPNALAIHCCLPCYCWDLSKPHTYQCYLRGYVLRGQPDNVALSHGIYDQVSTNELLSHFFFPWVCWYASTQTPGGCLGTPAFRLLFSRMSNISGHFFPLLMGTVLAVSHRWNVVLGNSWGGGLAMGVPVSSCDLWQRTFHSWICPSTAPSATQHGMEQCGKNLERGEEGIVCQPGLRRGGRIFQSYKNMPKKIYHWMTDGLSGIPSSNPDVVLSLSGSWTETHIGFHCLIC